MKSVIKWYVEIEFTGGSNMYYQKFHYRYHCTSIFRWAWKSSMFKNAILAEIGDPTFDKFSNCIFNDSMTCYEEGFERLEKIKEVEEKLDAGRLLDEEE
jgi:ubiquitin conjugation factor E4 B